MANINLKKLALVALAAVSATTLFGEVKERFFAYRSFFAEFEAMKNFGGVGVNTITIMPSNTTNSLGEPYCQYPVFWRGDGQYDWKAFDKQFEDVIAANPNAKIICIVDLNSAPWLMRTMSFGHTFDSDSFSMLSNSLVCRQWKKATERYLKDYLDRAEKKFGDKICAYMLACGHTDEWLDYTLGVSSPCKIAAWHAWLKKNKKPDADIPPLSKIFAPTFGELHKPNSAAVEYAKFANEAVAEAMSDFAKIARQKISKDKQIGSFFGYVHRNALDGHMAYEKVFADPNFDFFVSPGNYTLRAMGEASGFMTPNATRTRLGKGWLHEIDHRTHTFNHQLSEYVRIKNVANWKDQSEDDAGLKREFALATVNHTSLWCFDMWGKVFSTPETLETVRKGREIWGKFASDTSPTEAEIAVVFDTQSSILLAQKWKNAKYRTKLQNDISKIGAPVETFSFSDIGNIDLSKYRLVIFPHMFEITPERRELLEKYILRDGRTVVSSYAPAISDGKNLAPERVEKFCGFKFGAKGVNKKDMGGWTSVYIADPDDSSTETMREIAKNAGVHFYSDENVPVYANQKLLCVHVAKGGKKTVSLKGKCKKATELFTGKVVAENADSFEYEFKSPDTALFEIER